MGLAGLLIVYRAHADHIYQTYVTLNGSTYSRCCYAGSWRPWRQNWDDGNFDPASYLPKAGFTWAALPGKPATFPPSGHNHDTSQITSGILPLARGGLGANTAAGARNNIGAGVPATA
ncbi:pyocin knob domain-containing protein, partial [Pseudomonas aeruginosa]